MKKIMNLNEKFEMLNVFVDSLGLTPENLLYWMKMYKMNDCDYKTLSEFFVQKYAEFFIPTPLRLVYLIDNEIILTSGLDLKMRTQPWGFEYAEGIYTHRIKGAHFYDKCVNFAGEISDNGKACHMPIASIMEQNWSRELVQKSIGTAEILNKYGIDAADYTGDPETKLPNDWAICEDINQHRYRIFRLPNGSAGDNFKTDKSRCLRLAIAS